MQFGFRCQHSAKHAIVELVDKILNGFSEEKYTLGIFIDLSKGFDTVDHQILLKKLSLYGVKGKSLEWFESYLSERKQYIEVEGQKMSFFKYNMWCSPRVNLGPLLFLLYINDL